MTRLPILPSPLVLARITDGPLTSEAERAEAFENVRGSTKSTEACSDEPSGLVGAELCFQGIVRRGEPDKQDGGHERDLAALEYETYDPMAERELLALAQDIAVQYRLRSLVALHSRGRVGVGEVSFMLKVGSSHRAEALAAVVDFIDRLKHDVPIWKRPVWK